MSLRTAAYLDPSPWNFKEPQQILPGDWRVCKWRLSLYPVGVKDGQAREAG